MVTAFLIKEWEKNTGDKWPRYLVDCGNGGFKSYRFNAHYIIPKNYGGNDEWWNIHPVMNSTHATDVHSRSQKN